MNVHLLVYELVFRSLSLRDRRRRLTTSQLNEGNFS